MTSFTTLLKPNIGSIDVEKVGDKIIIDNAFIEKEYQRKGIGKSLVEKIKKDFNAKDSDIEFGVAVTKEGEAFKEFLGKKEPVKETQKPEPTEQSAIFAELNDAKSQVAREKAFKKFGDLRGKAEDVYYNFKDHLKNIEERAKEKGIEFKTDC